jgi:two-component system cell cycle response regulator CpdR
MGRSRPFRATALVVEDDAMQREMICVLLEESNYRVIQCESAEAAELVLDKFGLQLALMIADVSLAGRMSGVELAHIARQRNPGLDVVVTSGRSLPEPLPEGAKFWSKPWAALDIVREAELAQARGTAY